MFLHLDFEINKNIIYFFRIQNEISLLATSQKDIQKHRMKLCREIEDLETRSEEIESYSTTRQTASTIFFNNPSKVSAKRRLRRLRKFI
jgi:hypothetical protein